MPEEVCLYYVQCLGKSFESSSSQVSINFLSNVVDSLYHNKQHNYLFPSYLIGDTKSGKKSSNFR